ncbi:halocyanin domain-containing protein [Halalkalirubrum salinum]|uniref:halocyanin domain-containing protein n=1 Tax=Halalkalirubrum salinum TaxID=2563889 RepID=UPI0010FAD3BA|nr:halocyanin domain-containing protein [Halalkalirubrum salinum]
MNETPTGSTTESNTADSDSPRLSRRGCLRVGVAAAAIGTTAIAPVAAQDSDPYDGFFEDVDNYEGTVDARSEDSVTVAVGAGDGIQFDPAAVLVDPGTTVTWEWTGEGGGHNVAEVDGTFESEVVEDADHTFEHTFEDEGIFQYVCTPHEALGMKGAIAVGDVIDEEELIGGDTGDAGGDGGGGGDGDGGGSDGDGGGSDGGDGDRADSGTAGTAFPISTGALIGGAGVMALLSPALFAIVLKFVYREEPPDQ